MDFQYWRTLLYASFIPLLLILWFGHKKKQRIRNLPPGPRKLPLIGNLHQFGSLPHRSLAFLAQKYGPIMFLKLGSIPTIVISSYDVAREVFRTQDRVFAGRPVLCAANKLSYNCSDISFAPYGEAWRELRKIATLELLASKRVQSFQTVREEEVKFMLDYIISNASCGPINLTDLMILLTNNIVCQVTFGKKCYTQADGGRSKFQDTITEIQYILGGFCVADLFPWMKWFNRLNGFEAKIDKYYRELDGLYDEIIEEHKDPKRPRPENEDFVDVLLRLQKNPNGEITIRDDQMKGVLTDMFNAGTETASTTIVWTMTELIRNPKIMKKAQNEVREAVKGKFMVEETDLSNLVYLKLVIKEALRLHPPSPLLLPKKTIEDCQVCGYSIPADALVFINAFAISTDKKCWESPEEFLPERFLNSSVDFKGQNFEYIPFGAGRRGCPGIYFAIPILELAVANLLHCFDWKVPQGMSTHDIGVEEKFGLTTHKKTPLCLIATPLDFQESREYD